MLDELRGVMIHRTSVIPFALRFSRLASADILISLSSGVDPQVGFLD